MAKIWVSIGASQREINWKNKQVEWLKFVDRLHSTTRTDETYTEYLELGKTREGKDRQGQIKDVGGFVGGIISGGRRRIGSISARSLITLDLDYAPYDFIEELAIAYDWEFVVYSTHKHSISTPRYRLIIPLTREVLADEYEAIARKIAGNIDIEYFDPTTFQPERLMFWPSTSKDGEFKFYHQVGTWLDPDTILEQYEDWKDSSTWPISEKAKKKVKEGLEKQTDPTAKAGIIGTFCRTYGIAEAIERFIPDIYEPTVYENKWTYVHGSTSAGMIVYDNMFSLSYHATDPTSGRLCNSFDLIRIHKFGSLDEGSKEDTPHSKLPSFAKMTELIISDDEVKHRIISEKFSKGITQDFEQAMESTEWTKKLDIDKKGNILNTINNVVIILTNDPAFSNSLCYDDLRKTSSIKRDLPWRNINSHTREWVDSDDSSLRNYLETKYGIGNRSNIEDALTVVMHQNKFHPVREYLQSLVWDKKSRLDTLFIDYIGAEDTPYVRAVTRKTFVAAVARVYEPGIKFDNMTILIGPQGIGKSRLIARMGMDWYSDTFGNLQTNGAMENIQGVWIMEVGELAGFKRQEVESIKLFISKQEDRFRVAYARKVQSFPRQCIFIGSSNDETPLHDPTGGRRFWPVRVGLKEAVYLDKETRDQLWAEAVVLYFNGEELYLDQDTENLARKVQEEHTEQDDRKAGIREYLNTRLPGNWYTLNIYERISYLNGDPEAITAEGTMLREWVSIPEIWLEFIRGKQADMTPFNTRFIRNLMNSMEGWKSKMLNKKGIGPQRGWIRVEKICVTL